MLRPVKLHELFAIWDFEGKLDNQFNNHRQAMTMLQHRFYSPPGKIIRLIAHHLMNLRAAYFISRRPPPPVVTIKAVKSEDVPFTPLEDLAEVRAEAACPDDAEIDLSPGLSLKRLQSSLLPEMFYVVSRLSGGPIITPRKLMSGWQRGTAPSLMSWLWKTPFDGFKHAVILNGFVGVGFFTGGFPRNGMLISETESSFYRSQVLSYQKVV